MLDEQKKKSTERIRQEQEEARIQQTKKKDEKRATNLTPAQQFQLIGSAIALFFTTGYNTVILVWDWVQLYFNLARKLSTAFVESIGEGNSVQRESNARAIEEAIKYTLMIPFYIMAGISGVFMYAMESPLSGDRRLSVNESWIRRMLHKGEYLKYLIMSISPVWPIVRWLKYTDKKAYTESTLNVAGLLAKMPHIASYYIPMLLLILLFPTFSPSLFSIISAAAFILFQVINNIVAEITGVSIEDELDVAGSKIKADTSALDSAAAKRAEAASNAGGSSNAGGAGGMPKGLNPTTVAKSGSIAGMVYLVVYSLFQIILGLVSVIPAAFLSNLFIWIMTLFSYVLHNSQLTDVIRELNKDTAAYPNKYPLRKTIITILTNHKGLITTLICAFISFMSLNSIENDPALFIISTGIVLLTSISMGGLMDFMVRRWFTK